MPQHSPSRHIALRILVCTVCAFAAFVVCAAPLAAQTAGPSDPLHQLSSSVVALSRKVSPSVVQVIVTGYGQLGAGPGVVLGRGHAIGSGFVIDSSGYIITNAHVVSGAESIRVVFPAAPGEAAPAGSVGGNGNSVTGGIVGVANDIDLAVIKVNAENLPALPLASYSDLVQGELVFAFGSPEGFRNSVTMGVVSATARQIDPDSPMVYIQTDAPINPGNSGGPLVNANGEVVGVNTFILSQSGGSEGLGFAIPSSLVSASFDQIRRFGHVHRGEIGVSVQTITPTLAAALHLPRDSGLILSDVIPGSPADAAGLRIGDIVLRVDGVPEDNVPYFMFHLMTERAGDKMHIDVLRGSDRLAFDVPVVVRPHQVDQLATLVQPEKSLVRPLGILGLEITPEIAAQLPDLRSPTGILVVARAEESEIGNLFTTGDVIRALNGVPVTTLDGLRNALTTLPPGAPVALQIQRNDGLQFVSFHFEQP
jgi:serine protease Do